MKIATIEFQNEKSGYNICSKHWFVKFIEQIFYSMSCQFCFTVISNSFLVNGPFQCPHENLICRLTDNFREYWKERFGKIGKSFDL